MTEAELTTDDTPGLVKPRARAYRPVRNIVAKRGRVRAGEPYQTWFRSGRIHRIGGMWLICTREGIDVGPFDSEFEARKHERRLVVLLERATTPEEAHRIIYEYQHRPALAPR